MKMDKQKFISRVVHNTLKRCDDFPKDSIEIKPADLKFVLEYTVFIEECLSNLQKENEELKKLEKDHNYSVKVIIENSKLRYELAHSVSDEKIREKIEEVKNKPNNPNQKVIATQIDASLIALLHDLLKEEKEK